MDRKQIEECIVKKEWAMFQQVHGINGRAKCQDDSETFVIMRVSQFESYPLPVIESYLHDLEQAEAKDRNLIMEKYAHMMEQTDPEYYLTIKGLLPQVTTEAMLMARAITKKYMEWEKEIEIDYPNVRSQGRVASGISLDGRASFENYLFCELKTYSENTLSLLLEHMTENPDDNLYKTSLEKMAAAYGYDSLDAAEKALAEARRR